MKPKQTEAPRPIGGQTKYGKREKLFGSAAERISREEYDAVVDEIRHKAGDNFRKLEPPEQLTDKESFGDIDLIVLTDAKVNEDFLCHVFSESLLEYHRGKTKTGDNYIYNTLIRLDSGKQVQVDFVRADDEEDFERKHLFYSKGHLFPLLGIMARRLHFKCSDRGFFKRYKDSKGQYHHVPITENLEEGLRILGLDPKKRAGIQTLDDVADFIASSPFFASRDFDTTEMVRRYKVAVKRSGQQQWVSKKLVAINKQREIEDEDQFFKDLFPEKYEDYKAGVEEIEKTIHLKRAIDGHVVMEKFGLEPSPAVGDVLKFLERHYPDAEEFTEEMIRQIKEEILS